MGKFVRALLVLIIIGVLVWYFAPRLFSDAANSLINSVDSSVAQAQGLAEFVPAGVNSSQSSKGDLQINLSGLTPNSKYELTLDQDQCGSTVKDLGPVNSDTNGGFYIELPLASLDVKQIWFVDVHEQDALGQSVACGQLQTNQSSSTQAIDATQSGPNVFGAQQPLQNSQSDTASSTANAKPTHLPNTGMDPDNHQQYDNNQYPRKY